MNLKEFLEYRSACPICDNKTLSSFFGSMRKQKINYENNKFITIFDLLPIYKNHKKYKVGYEIDLYDNSFTVDFYNNDDTKLNVIPVFLMERFQELKNNIGTFTFIRSCSACDSYNYYSNPFELTPRITSIGTLNIRKEYFGLSKMTKDGYKVYKLYNQYDSNSSDLFCGYKINHPRAAKYNTVLGAHTKSCQNISNVGIINFTNRDDVISRIDKLLLFS